MNATGHSTPRESLQATAHQIETLSLKSDDRIIEAALLVRALRARVESGEAGPITWHEWARQNFTIQRTRLYELQQIAAAADPHEELERIRKMTGRRLQKLKVSRSVRDEDLEPERLDLINFARTRSLEAVKRLLDISRPDDTGQPIAD